MGATLDGTHSQTNHTRSCLLTHSASWHSYARRASECVCPNPLSTDQGLTFPSDSVSARAGLPALGWSAGAQWCQNHSDRGRGSGLSDFSPAGPTDPQLGDSEKEAQGLLLPSVPPGSHAETPRAALSPPLPSSQTPNTTNAGTPRAQGPQRGQLPQRGRVVAQFRDQGRCPKGRDEN